MPPGFECDGLGAWDHISSTTIATGIWISTLPDSRIFLSTIRGSLFRSRKVRAATGQHSLAQQRQRHFHGLDQAVGLAGNAPSVGAVGIDVNKDRAVDLVVSGWQKSPRGDAQSSRRNFSRELSVGNGNAGTCRGNCSARLRQRWMDGPGVHALGCAGIESLAKRIGENVFSAFLCRIPDGCVAGVFPRSITTTTAG